MKIIIREYVENLGDKGDIVTVADGYARNYLIPRKLAIRATKSELRQQAHRQKFIDRREKRLEKQLVARVDTIKSTEIEIEVHASSAGKLYGSIVARHIAEALTEKLDVEIDRRRILLDSPIKQLGEYQVTVKLGEGSKVEVKVNVTSGGGPVSEEDEGGEKQAEASEEKQPEAEEAAAAEEAVVEAATEEAAEEAAATEEAAVETTEGKAEEAPSEEAADEPEAEEPAEEKTEEAPEEQASDENDEEKSE